MSIEAKANAVLDRAKIIASDVSTWADFSNALFDPHSGLVAKTFSSDIERQAFYDSRQYQKISDILVRLMKRFGTAGGATPEKSGRFVVRVAKSLHQSLDIEARRQGVSLNQLINIKLAPPLAAADVPKALIVEAFTEICEGYATDAVIVHPDLNAKFIAACRKKGLEQGEFELNLTLMRTRKMSSKEKERHGIVLPSATKRLQFSDYDEFAFASEIAVRVLQRTEGITLDRILCDPKLRQEFDALAKKLVSGLPEVKLRCAALNLRKTHRLRPIDSSMPEYTLESVGPVKMIDLSQVPETSGMYAFFDSNRPIFAGETEQLRHRVERHLDAGLPSWLDALTDESFHLKISNAPTNRGLRLSWLQDFINRERPLLNYQQVA